jgi:DUF3108-like
MSKHGSVKAVLAGAAILALAGCGVPAATTPDIPSATDRSNPAGASPEASSAAPAGSAHQSATSATSAGRKADAKSFVKANSIPFPVAVGNTWVYQTTAGGQTGQTTNRIVAAEPNPAGYTVVMSSTTDIAGVATAVQPLYVFHPDGTIGYPVPAIDGVSVAGGGINWPDAAGLASGDAYHSVLPIRLSHSGQYENANVTVQGAGTATVHVPAGTYQASIVDTTIAAKVDGSIITLELTTWIAQGVGPVQTEELIIAAGQPTLSITSELLSFTKAAKGAVVGIGS